MVLEAKKLQCTISLVNTNEHFKAAYAVYVPAQDCLYFVVLRQGNALVRYSIQTGKFETYKTNILLPSDMHSMVLCNDKIYICTGGVHATLFEYHNDMVVFDTNLHTFEKYSASDAPSRRVRSSIACRYDANKSQHTIVIYAGYDRIDWKNDMFQFGTLSKQWEQVQYKQNIDPGKRLTFGFHYCNKTDRLFIHGGYNG